MTEITDLFREEALRARRTRLEGEVLLSTPLRMRVMLLILGCAAVIVVTWVATAQYARTERVRGILLTDTEAAKIIALHPGIVTRLVVHEGQTVDAGQILATVRMDQADSEGGRTSQESLDAIAAQQRMTIGQIAAAGNRAKSERASALATIASSRAQYEEVQNQLTIQRQLIRSLVGTLERYGPVANRGFISQTEMDRRQQEVLNARQELGRLEQQLVNLRADQAKALAELDRADAEEASQTAAARSSAEGFRAQQAQIRGQQGYVLVAPRRGIITALQAAVGRTVDPSVPLMTIMPQDATLHIELYAPSRSVGFVRVGQEVRLMYDAFPYERFGTFEGRINAVSRVALDPRQIDIPLKIEEPVYRISVTPNQQTVEGYSERIRLQPGMTLTANIVLERRSFIQWLLEPLYAVVKRGQ